MTNIDIIREALYELAKDTATGWSHWTPNEAYKTGFETGVDKALAAISTIDPDAIRQECAEKNCEVCEHEYEQTLCGGTIKNPRRPDHCKFRAAILGKEAEK